MSEAGIISVAMVTGGASGIGRASTTALVDAGYHVALLDLDEAGMREVVAHAGDVASISTHCVDISDGAMVDAVVSDVVRRFGRVDALVHCAAINRASPLMDTSDEDWSRILGINLDGTFYLVRSVSKAMVAAGRGAIVCMTSDRALAGSKNHSAYAASKGGVISLIKSVAYELGPFGVTINGINPGLTVTPMSRAALSAQDIEARAASDPLSRLSTPEDIARIVAFLVAPTSNFITGQIITTRLAR